MATDTALRAGCRRADQRARRGGPVGLRRSPDAASRWRAAEKPDHLDPPQSRSPRPRGQARRPFPRYAPCAGPMSRVARPRAHAACALGRAGTPQASREPGPGVRRAHRPAREPARARLREPGRQECHQRTERGDRSDSDGRAPRKLRAPRQSRGTGRGPPFRPRQNHANAMNAAVPVAGARAGFVTRLAALIADLIIVWVALRGTLSLLRVIEHALRRFAPPVSVSNMLLVSGPVITCLYCIVLWWLRGQTPGKWLLGIRVVTVGGGRVGIVRAAVRFAGYLLSALPFYLGFFWVPGRERRGFHDRLAGTEVVYVRRPARQLPADKDGDKDRPVVPRRYSTA